MTPVVTKLIEDMHRFKRVLQRKGESGPYVIAVDADVADELMGLDLGLEVVGASDEGHGLYRRPRSEQAVVLNFEHLTLLTQDQPGLIWKRS